MRWTFLVIAAMALIVTSCDDDTTDNQAPLIDIISPLYSSGGEYYSHPDSTNIIEINVQITDDEIVKSASLSINQDYMRGNIPRGEVMRMDYTPDASSFNIDEQYVIDTAHHSNIWIFIEAEDDAANKAKDSVLIHVHS